MIPGAAPAALEAVGVERRRGAHRILDGVDVSVGAGEALAVTGPSGAGKSTLLGCVGLLEPADAGRIRFPSGRVVDAGSASRGAARRRRRAILREDLGFVMQDFALVPEWDVARNVDVALAPEGGPRRRRRERVAAALEKVGLGGRGGENVTALSGGERQRVALARVLAKRPPLVLADEPTGSLDAGNRDRVLAVFEELLRLGTAILVVTHDPQVADWAARRLDLGGGGRGR